MSYIENITQSQSTSGTDSSTKKSKTDDIMGKEDFLTLLVAQLKNQDPLNPDDPTEFTSQLAQFSSLEQLTNLNESMENMAISNANSDRFATLQTIGKNVVYQDSSFTYNGQDGAQLGYKLDGEASEVTLSIKRNGSVIKVLHGTELSKGNHILNWDGLTETGTAAERGTYTVSVSVKTADGSSIAVSPLIQSEVTGVDLTGEFGGTLETRAGVVAFSSILGVYENKTADN
jgi:flagellar basal-body rod modification protein FlgD